MEWAERQKSQTALCLCKINASKIDKNYTNDKHPIEAEKKLCVYV